MSDAGAGLRPVAPGVLVRRRDPWSTATTVVLGADGGCLVVDPGLTPADLDSLADELAGLGLRVVAGFATHAHWDHVLWSARLGEAPRWATPRTARDAATDRSALAREADGVAPGHDHDLTGRLVALPEGVDRVPWAGPDAVVVPYPAHRAGSAGLWLPGPRVLVAGDVLSDAEVPLLDPDDPDALRRHAAGLVRLTAAAEGAAVLVQGHGTTTDAAGLRARLADDLAYLGAVEAEVPVTDRRLADPGQRREHEAQVARLRQTRRTGGGATP